MYFTTVVWELSLFYTRVFNFTPLVTDSFMLTTSAQYKTVWMERSLNPVQISPSPTHTQSANMSKQVLWPNQPLCQWVPRLFAGYKAAEHDTDHSSQHSTRAEIEWSCISMPLCFHVLYETTSTLIFYSKICQIYL